MQACIDDASSRGWVGKLLGNIDQGTYDFVSAQFDRPLDDFQDDVFYEKRLWLGLVISVIAPCVCWLASNVKLL